MSFTKFLYTEIFQMYGITEIALITLTVWQDITLTIAIPKYQEFNISIEGGCLTAYTPCTNALRQVTPVNYRILSDIIYA